MSLFRTSLEDFTSEDLYEELARREKAYILKRCDYCNRKYSEKSCKFPDRHKAQKVARKHVYVPKED